MEYIKNFTDYLVRQSWQVAILFLLIAIGSFLLRNKSSHWRYLLWCVILAKCLLPPVMTFNAAVLPLDTVRQSSMVIEEPRQGIDGSLQRESGIENKELNNQKPNNNIQTISNNQNSKEPRYAAMDYIKEHLRIFVFAIWGIGAVAFLLVAGVRAFLLNRWILKHRQLPGEDVSGEIEKLKTTVSSEFLSRIWVVEKITQPFVWGLWKGNAYLPAESKNSADVIMHELAHIIRLDAFVNLLQIFAQAIFWFHPFVWLANNKIRAEREKSCDEIAIARLKVSPRSYSSAVVDVLVREYQARKALPSLAVAGPVKNIEERIRTIMAQGKKFYSRPTAAAVITVLVLAAICVPTTIALTKVGEPDLVIKGKVVDSATGRPIAGAKVGDAERYNEGKFQTTTDANGDYSYKTWYEEHNLKCQAAGYESKNESLFTKVLGSENEKVINFELKPNVIATENTEDTEIEKTKQGDFIATLSNGTTVELIGVCEHPSEGKQWWGPNGEPLGYEIETLDKSNYPSPDPGYEFVYKTSLGFDQILIGEKDSTTSSNIDVLKPKGLFTGRRAHIKAGINKTNINIGVVFDTTDWNTIAEHNGQGTTFRNIDGGKVIFSQANDSPDGLLITITDDLKNGNANRLIVLDKSGKENRAHLQTSLTVNGMRQQTFVAKEIKAENATNYKFQQIPYKYVIFKNISLKPNFKTDVQIGTETEPQRHKGTKATATEGTKVKKTKQGDFTATLSNGTIVELVGVCEHPSEGQQWWRPNGEIIKDMPYSIGGQIIEPTEGYQRLDLIAKIINANEQSPGIKFIIPGATRTSVGKNVAMNQMNVERGMWAVRFKIDSALNFADITAGVASGEWQTISKIISNFKNIQRNDVDFGQIEWLKVIEENNEVTIYASNNFSDKAEFKIVAEDIIGEIYPAYSSHCKGNAGLMSCEYKFHLSPDKAKEFKFQIRPYEWVEFKNVLLKPNFKTDVQVGTVEDSRKLLMERRDILQETLQRVEMNYDAGRADSKQLGQAKIDLLRVEIELSETPQKRIEFLSQFVTIYAEQEKLTKLFLDAGRATQDELNKVKLERLDAEEELAKAKAETKEQQNIDIYIEDFDIRPYEAGGLYTVTMKIGNHGTVDAPQFRLNFYKGNPADNLNLHGKPQTGYHGAGPIKAGDFWNESSSSSPFALKEGKNLIFVVLDINNDVAEANENNNQAMLGIVVKDGKIVEKRFAQSVIITQSSDGQIGVTMKGVRVETIGKSCGPDDISLFGAGQAEGTEGQKEKLQNLVEDFFKNNYRDITARKTIEWGEPIVDANDNMTISYKYEMIIWDKDKFIADEIFTFDKNGKFLSVQKVKGFPKSLGSVEVQPEDVSTKESIQKLVEKFFSRNYRDITARRTIEWGEPNRSENGNVSIQYKYEATIWGKDKIITNQLFVFDKDGKLISFNKIEDDIKLTAAETNISDKPEVYIVKFRPNNRFNPQTSRELLDVFNDTVKGRVKTHHFRTKIENDILAGYVLCDSRAEQKAIALMLADSSEIEFVGFQLATEDKLARHYASEQQSLNTVSKGTAFDNLLSKKVTVDIDKSPDGSGLTVQYAVIAVCEAAGVPYKWDKSAKLAEPQRLSFIKPLHIKDKTAGDTIADILKPFGLNYAMDSDGLFIYKK